MPSGAVTVTSAAPALPAGVMATSFEGPTTVRPVTGVPPMVTVSPAAKPAPVRVTTVPPSGVPRAGLTAQSAGPVAWASGRQWRTRTSTKSSPACATPRLLVPRGRHWKDRRESAAET